MEKKKKTRLLGFIKTTLTGGFARRGFAAWWRNEEEKRNEERKKNKVKIK
jgi:hypothetical protein